MCGIAGIICIKSKEIDIERVVRNMISSISHRGPDGCEFWANSNKTVGIGHARLAILELSSAGSQPMISSNQRYIITFNGEIYNHLAIRRNLECEYGPILWKGNSDAETIVECLVRKGISDTLGLLSGMFAIGIFDQLLNKITLVRDRVGEKPLYYMLNGKTVYFASELKAFRVVSDKCLTIDPIALDHLLRYSYIKSPRTIYSEVKTLEAGHYLEIDLELSDCMELNEQISYWELNNTVSVPTSIDFEQMSDDLQEMLVNSLQNQMIADVPVGGLLSGGVDSTLLVALIRRELKLDLQTFSVGFQESAYNEALYAKETAKFFGTDHNELYVTGKMAIDCVDELPFIYDEPLGDPSQIPTLIISRFARNKVKVILSGDGADELFGGYNRHRIAKNIWPKMESIPYFFRNFIGMSIKRSPNGTLKNLEFLYRLFQGKSSLPKNWQAKANKIENLFACKAHQSLYGALIQNFGSQTELVFNTKANRRDIQCDNSSNIVDAFLQEDFLSYLPDNVLVKLDRASMSVGLESRAPYLDRSIVEYASSLPAAKIFNNRIGKAPLRHILDRYIPQTVTSRPKSGFSVPLDEWIRGPLNCWARDLVLQKGVSETTNINIEFYRNRLSEHLSGKKNYGSELWPALTFLNWFGTYHGS